MFLCLTLRLDVVLDAALSLNLTLCLRLCLAVDAKKAQKQKTCPCLRRKRCVVRHVHQQQKKHQYRTQKRYANKR